jgi:hypothetical protein
MLVKVQPEAPMKIERDRFDVMCQHCKFQKGVWLCDISFLHWIQLCQPCLEKVGYQMLLFAEGLRANQNVKASV